MPNELDPERFTLRQAAQARDRLRPGDGRAGVREGSARPHPDAQGSGVCPGENNIRVSSDRRCARHPLAGSVLANSV